MPSEKYLILRRRAAPSRRTQDLLAVTQPGSVGREAELRQGDVVVQLLEDDLDAPPDLRLGVFGASSRLPASNAPGASSSSTMMLA